VPSVRNARRCVEIFRKLGHERLLKVVVNRFQKSAEISADVVADTVDLPVSAMVSNDYPAVVRAVNKGVLLMEQAPRAQVTRELEGLVSLLVRATPQSGAERKSLLQRFFAPRLSHGT
jgi:pilus assembly protein CpaE